MGALKAEQRCRRRIPCARSEQIDRLRRLAHDAHLDPEFAEKFLTFIVTEVVRHHEEILRPSPGEQV